MAVARIADANRQRARRARGTSFVWPHLRLLRVVALCLRRLHRQHGAYLATGWIGICLLHGARSHRGWNWDHGRDSSPFSGHSRSDHDELVWPSGLGAEPVGAATAQMGRDTPKSMVRAPRDPVVSRFRVDCRGFIAKPPLG